MEVMARSNRLIRIVLLLVVALVFSTGVHAQSHAFKATTASAKGTVSIDASQAGAKMSHAMPGSVPSMPAGDKTKFMLTNVCEPTSISRTEDTTCTVTAGNNTPATAAMTLKDVVPLGLGVIPSTVQGGTRAGNTIAFSGSLPSAINNTPGQTPGYLPLGPTFGIPPQDCQSTSCDDAGLIFQTPPFTYGGKTYTQVTMVSNGYVTVGTDTTIAFRNQRFPDSTPPNNVIAPYWTDLDLHGSSPTDVGGGDMYAAFVNNGVTNWFVAEWANAQEYGVPSSSHSFQVWITLGNGPSYMEYGPTTATPPLLTVGAENESGMLGTNYYAETASDATSTGSVPVAGTELTVDLVAATHVIHFKANAREVGTFTSVAQLTSPLIRGRSHAQATVVVNPR